MRRFKAVVFDWAGTTIDYGSFAPMGAIVEAFSRFGVAITILEARVPMGLPKRAHIAALLADPGIAARWREAQGAATDEAAIDRVYETFVPLNEEVAPRYATLVPGTAEAVARLFAAEPAAADVLAAFARREGLALDAIIGDFAVRSDALAGHGIDLSSIAFEAAFGRRIGYYTGFVFEMIDPARPDAEVIAGGRYDRLIALLDPSRALPAIGFSVWLDRLPEAP